MTAPAPRPSRPKRGVPWWVWALGGGTLATFLLCGGLIVVLVAASRRVAEEGQARFDAAIAAQAEATRRAELAEQTEVAAAIPPGAGAEARAEAVGRAVEEVLNRGDSDAAAALLDVNFLAKRVGRGLNFDRDKLRVFADHFRTDATWMLTDAAETAGGPGGSTRYVGVTTYRGEPVAVLRVLNDDWSSGVRHLYLLPTPGGLVGDVFDSLAGYGLAEFYRLTETDRAASDAAFRMSEAEESEEALAIFASLPPSSQRHRYVQYLRLRAVTGLTRDSWTEAINELDDRFEDDLAIANLRWEAAEGASETVAALEGLAAVTARDPYLLGALAEWLPDVGRTEEAAAIAAEAVAAEPDLPTAHRGVLSAAIGRGDWPAAVAALRTLRDRIGEPVPPEEVRSWYPDGELLLASPVYHAYAAEVGDAIGAAKSLTDALAGFETNLAPPPGDASSEDANLGEPPAAPPAGGNVSLVTYPSAVGELPAYLFTPGEQAPEAPRDGRAAIVWITGGDCQSIGPVWEAGPPENDQTASAYRDAGLVMLFPSLRGGNANPGRREGFLGEVNDVLAAAAFLAERPGVDPDRIYLGGHSAGGTLAALVAERSDRFRATFAFGPVFDVRGYGGSSLYHEPPHDWREAAVRSPGYWLDDVTNPLFLIEGGEGNADALRTLRRATQNPRVRTFLIPDADHFAVLAPANVAIARAIRKDDGPRRQIELTVEELAGER